MGKFKIKFKGQEEGQYFYKFEIKDSFFNDYSESQIKKAEVNANIELLVTKDLLTFNINLQGHVELQCDRCLDYFDYPISYKTVLYADFGEENSDLSDADNKITLARLNDEIELDKHFYDYLHLCLPYQKIHPVNEKGVSLCNQTMIKKIEEFSAEKKKAEIDPRWDKLKSLYN